MKKILLVVLFLVILFQYSKADKLETKEPEILSTYSIDGYKIYISCLNGYKYIITPSHYGSNMVQMFQEYKDGGNYHVTSIPVSCR